MENMFSESTEHTERNQPQTPSPYATLVVKTFSILQHLSVVSNSGLIPWVWKIEAVLEEEEGGGKEGSEEK